MKYKLKDLQGVGSFEDITFETKEQVRDLLEDYHSIDCKIEKGASLEYLLDLGDWELIEIN